MRFDHPQLDPELNRVRRVPGSPAAPVRGNVPVIDQPDPDPCDPYRNAHTGLFSGGILDENGDPVRYALYVPSTMKTSGRCGIAFLPSGTRAEDFVKAHNWERVLEKHEVSLFFLEASDGWHAEESGYALDLTAKMLAELRSMERFPANGCNIYCFGFGDGAATAAVCAMLHAGVFAAFSAWGDCKADPELLSYIGGLPSDGDPGVTKAEVRFPAYILDDDCNTLSYFRNACACRDEELYNSFARIWREEPKPGLRINAQPVCEVWQTRKEDAKVIPFDTVIDRMLGFAVMFCRRGGQDNWYLRRTITPESEGLILHETQIDGLKRRYRIYEPEAYRRKRLEKYPLVVAVHGFSCSGPFFMEDSVWHWVAEERGFLVCYPTAYPTKRGMMGRGSIAPTPAWNSSLVPDPNGPDDVSFFRQMIEEICREYPVDRERIYISGHSNGSAMTQRLMRFAPELFAGFNPVGGMERGANGEVVPEPEDGYRRPVWYFMSEYDRSGPELEEGGMNALTVQSLCRANGMEHAKDRDYVNGIYHHHVFYDASHMPLVRFTGVARTPHTFSPEMALTVWDEFFVKLRRHPDGSVDCLG